MQADSKCAVVDTPPLKSIPDEEMNKSDASVARKRTNTAYRYLIFIIVILWCTMLFSVLFFLNLHKKIDPFEISTVVHFAAITIADVVNRHWLMLLSPTLTAGLFMYAYLYLFRHLTKVFTLALNLLLVILCMGVGLISAGVLKVSIFEAPQSDFGNASIFYCNLIFIIYLDIIFMCFTKKQDFVHDIHEVTLSALFYCFIPLLFIIPSAVFMSAFTIKAVALEWVLLCDTTLPQTVRYFLRSFNFFSGICIFNFYYNIAQLITVQHFANWYRKKGKVDFQKHEILKNITTAYEVLYYHAGTAMYESLPLVPHVHAMILMFSCNHRPIKNFGTIIVQYICKFRLIIEITGFANVFTSIYGYDFHNSARKSINILLNNCIECVAALDMFYAIRFSGLLAIAYLYSATVSRDFLERYRYLLVGDKLYVEEINLILTFAVAGIITVLAVIIDFIISTGLKVILLCTLEDNNNNNNNNEDCKKTIQNESSV